MKTRTIPGLLVALLTFAGTASTSPATETENTTLHILPAQNAITVDGKFDDWDLSGGLFACGDVEFQRETFSVWLHAMYDADNVYFLARWKDETPLDNHYQSVTGMGFNNDCLQFRTITFPGSPKERLAHWSFWQGCDKLNVLSVHYGPFTRQVPYARDASVEKAGGKMAFAVDPDGKGYAQELAIPWAAFTDNQGAPKAGDVLTFTLEPNWTLPAARLTIKDILKAGGPDRVFTFMSEGSWGKAVLEPAGKIAPPAVRLTDGRTFAVSLRDGLPAINWTGLIRPRDLRGFKAITFDMPVDGYASLIIKNKAGDVVRHLLSCDFYAKGKVELKWDGLGTGLYRAPGLLLPAGDYEWQGIYHKGIGLRLRGWACNGGIPWYNGVGTGWGGDHGAPVTVAAGKDRVVLGWSGAEAGSAIVVCDLDGKVKWTYSSGGMCGCGLVALDDKAIYVVDENSPDAAKTVGLYRTELDRSMMITTGELPGRIPACNGFDVLDGRLYFSSAATNELRVISGADGKLLKTLALPAPSALDAVTPTLVYVVSARRSVLAVNPETGAVKPFAADLGTVSSVAAGPDGRVYVGLRDPDNVVRIFNADGSPAGEIGRQGQRAIGPWVPEQMKNIEALAVDPRGQLWVTEAEMSPKRVVVWNTKDRTLVRELFGPTHYGASGAAICPTDPDIMVGESCEWRLDPTTGLSRCTGTFGAGGSFARFAIGSNKRVYLILSQGGIGYEGELGATILERLGEGVYKTRAKYYCGNKKAPRTWIWSDANDDQQEQPDEIQTIDGRGNVTGYCGWALYAGYDLTLYPDHYLPEDKAERLQLKVTGFTPCGAPRYDLKNPRIVAPDTAMAFPMKVESRAASMPMPSPDNAMLCAFGQDSVVGYDVATARNRWWYPCSWFGVHGSHYAPPAEVGLLRGVFGLIGSATLPRPLGHVWVCNSNVGEWHMFSEDGYYVTRLFQGDPMRQRFPAVAGPGAILDNAPPGLGGEDFGGTFMQDVNGKVYCQAGKIGIWNVEVTGLENVKALKGGRLSLSEADVLQAKAIRETWIQENVGTRTFAIAPGTPKLNGETLEFDKLKSAVLTFKKSEDAGIYVRSTWDAGNLYVCWEVRDNTPWKNGAGEAKMMYVGGDTVDLQLGTDPKADRKRSEPGRGDLRLSIGPFQGPSTALGASKPTAVLYRKVSDEKQPATFSSGVVKTYTMDYVAVAPEVRTEVRVGDNAYTVAAAIPWSLLGVTPQKGLKLRADFGATHGDPGGTRTRLRTFWNNQHTGIVDDSVFELQMEPCNWGEIVLE